jgi:hypothetical protein
MPSECGALYHQKRNAAWFREAGFPEAIRVHQPATRRPDGGYPGWHLA